MWKLLKFTSDFIFYSMVLFAVVTLTLQIVQAQQPESETVTVQPAQVYLTGNSIQASR